MNIPVPDLKIQLAMPKKETRNREKILAHDKDRDVEPKELIEEIVEEQISTREARMKNWPGFNAIGGQEKAVAEARKLVQAIKNAELYQKRGVKQPKGILFYGPPGTGKTMLAKAIAKEAGAEFFEITVADIGSKWHSESERKTQALFDEANSIASEGEKVIIFFDEFDALAVSREERHYIDRKVLSVILQNMDGMRSNPNVTIIGATNRPQDVDPAMKRSGRIDKLIEVGLPDKKGRIAIFKIHLERARKRSTDPDNLFSKEVDYEAIAAGTEGLSGADIENLVNLSSEEKLTGELSGQEWTPLTTENFLKTVNEMGRFKKEKKKLGF